MECCIKIKENLQSWLVHIDSKRHYKTAKELLFHVPKTVAPVRTSFHHGRLIQFQTDTARIIKAIEQVADNVDKQVKTKATSKAVTTSAIGVVCIIGIVAGPLTGGVSLLATVGVSGIVTSAVAINSLGDTVIDTVVDWQEDLEKVKDDFKKLQNEVEKLYKCAYAVLNMYGSTPACDLSSGVPSKETDHFKTTKRIFSHLGDFVGIAGAIREQLKQAKNANGEQLTVAADQISIAVASVVNMSKGIQAGVDIYQNFLKATGDDCTEKTTILKQRDVVRNVCNRAEGYYRLAQLYKTMVQGVTERNDAIRDRDKHIDSLSTYMRKFMFLYAIADWFGLKHAAFWNTVYVFLWHLQAPVDKLVAISRSLVPLLSAWTCVLVVLYAGYRLIEHWIIFGVYIALGLAMLCGLVLIHELLAKCYREKDSGGMTPGARKCFFYCLVVCACILLCPWLFFYYFEINVWILIVPILLIGAFLSFCWVVCIEKILPPLRQFFDIFKPPRRHT